MEHQNNINSNRKTVGRDIKGGYNVPDGYFDQLKANVMASVGQKQEKVSWKTTTKSVLGFAAGFAAMVLFAVGVVKLTPTDKKLTFDTDLDQFMLYSAVSEDDIIDIVIDINEGENQSDKQSFNQAVDEYITLYGAVDTF